MIFYELILSLGLGEGFAVAKIALPPDVDIKAEQAAWYVGRSQNTSSELYGFADYLVTKYSGVHIESQDSISLGKSDV